MNINFLGLPPTQYSIESEPTAQVMKSYLGGETLRRYTFVLSARYDIIMDSDRAANAENYEKLSLWLEKRTRLRQLPPMGDGQAAQSLLALDNVYLAEREDDNNAARYMMQLELIYKQKARI